MRLHDIEYAEMNGKVTFACRNASFASAAGFNFNSGVTAQYVSTTIMTETDRQIARQRSQRLKEEDTTVKQRLDRLTRKITAGKMILDIRQYCLTSDIRDHVRGIVQSRQDKDLAKKHREDLAYMKACHKADKVLEKNGTDNLQNWKSKMDILVYLRPLKTKEDPKLPSNRNEIEKLVLSWNNRAMDKSVLRSFDEWTNEENQKNRGKSNEKK